MKLFTDAQRDQLIRNGQNPDQDHVPVVKLFYPYGAGTWLITELDPGDERLAFGLCDLGMGFPELGYIWIPELEEIRVERDLYFTADRPISAYAKEAHQNGGIVA